VGLFDEVVPVDLRISYFSAQLLFLGAKVRLKNNTKRRKNRIAMSAIYNKKSISKLKILLYRLEKARRGRLRND